jgi:16S rRNA (guanine966-N2)-methyltransferase
VVGASCLDVFAGSGSLGFEALSRGAKSVTMLELNSENFEQLQKNKQLLQVDNLELYKVDSLEFLSQAKAEAFDVIFIDPPFHKDLISKTLVALFAAGFIKDSTILYLELERKLSPPSLPNGWQSYKEKTTSQVQYGLFKKIL